MISALANIVTKGNSATQSLSDAFASANHEFGMADRLIGGYEVTDSEPVGQKGEEQTTKIAEVEEVLPDWSVDHAQIIDLVNGQSSNGKVYQLSLLSAMQPVAREVNGHQNGHHQNGTSNGHANKNGHVQKNRNDQKRLIGVPQLEMPILRQTHSKAAKSSKRRRFQVGPSLFDWLNKSQSK